MKKNIKWILLIITIVLLIITFILFINFNKERKKNNIKNSEIIKLYDKMWLRTGIRIYENSNLISENLALMDTRYLLFEKEKVSYCTPENDICTDYNYTYNKEDNTIYFDSEDYFVVKGTYEIVINEDSFELTLNEDNTTIVYTFKTPKG